MLQIVVQHDVSQDEVVIEGAIPMQNEEHTEVRIMYRSTVISM